ncbi:hypothetical protein CC2G_000446 [Coprinopsis cinerea AmutBmut pab1-1]|nr:hypothetical protein CC2G_000446 [Coprinopsis cinerea AmutBmut pab1-1]
MSNAKYLSALHRPLPSATRQLASRSGPGLPTRCPWSQDQQTFFDATSLRLFYDDDTIAPLLFRLAKASVPCTNLALLTWQIARTANASPLSLYPQTRPADRSHVRVTFAFSVRLAPSYFSAQWSHEQQHDQIDDCEHIIPFAR